MTSGSEGGVEGSVGQSADLVRQDEAIGDTGQEVGLAAGSEVVIPGTGELVDLTDAVAVAEALGRLREWERNVYEAKQAMTRIIANYAQQTGSLTFELPGGGKAEVTVRPDIVYDAEAIEEQLREAGCPEETIAKIIKEEVSHKVVAVEAKKAASANPKYREIIESNRTEVQKNPSVTIRKG